MPLARSGLSAFIALAAFALLGACSNAPNSSGLPSFYQSLASGGSSVDAQTAASMISGYRANNGLGPVTVDADLTRMAQAQAEAMAKRGRVDRNSAGTLAERLRRGGYDASVAGENTSAGYHTLAEAFSGWRESPSDRANMLLRGATKMGIAAVHAPHSKYKVFWSLILAAPGERRG